MQLTRPWMSKGGLDTQSMQGLLVLLSCIVTNLSLARHLFMNEEIEDDMAEMCKIDERGEFVIDGDYQVEDTDLDSGWEVSLLEGVIFTLAKILEVTAIQSLQILFSPIEYHPSPITLTP